MPTKRERIEALEVEVEELRGRLAWLVSELSPLRDLYIDRQLQARETAIEVVNNHVGLYHKPLPMAPKEDDEEVDERPSIKLDLITPHYTKPHDWHEE
jgi:hypothetical protein